MRKTTHELAPHLQASAPHLEPSVQEVVATTGPHPVQNPAIKSIL
ncbi:hypothetical protein AVEN_267148-1, partial [Araneus ventricosus]